MWEKGNYREKSFISNDSFKFMSFLKIIFNDEDLM